MDVTELGMRVGGTGAIFLVAAMALLVYEAAIGRNQDYGFVRKRRQKLIKTCAVIGFGTLLVAMWV